MYMQNVLVCPNFNFSTEIQIFTGFDMDVLSLVLKTNSAINIFLILIAESDSSAVEGHNSSFRKAINTTSNVVIDKMCTLLTFVWG
jgi:hypothetical protein